MLKLILISLLALVTVESTFGQSLTLYSEANLAGESKPLENGLYRGGLGQFNDWAVSFELQPGHLATFADNQNGSGHSRLYVADASKIAINLPPDLQRTVSFVRVGPWRNARKKSVCGAGLAMLEPTNTSWVYNWGSGGKTADSLEYVPMSWGGGTDEAMKKLGARMDVSHHLGFNEPDSDHQANLSPEQAVKKFKILQGSGLRLGSPGPRDNASGRVWLDKFMELALEEDLRVDFMSVHYYKKNKPEALRRWLSYVDSKYGLPVWVTEVNYGAPWNWNARPPEEKYARGLIGYMEMLDEIPFVERYAVFNWQPPSALSIYKSRKPDVLNRAGEAYQKHESPPAMAAMNYVPIPWTDHRVGKFYPVSKASFLNDEHGGSFEIRAAGRGISATDDQFHFVHQAISSGAAITARIRNISELGESTQAGIMIRDAHRTDSKFVMISLTAEGKAIVRFRSSTGDNTGEPVIKLVAGKPSMLRLTRDGSQFIASVSSSGKAWQEIIRCEIEMSDTLSYGLCASSAKPGQSVTVAFDKVVTQQEQTPNDSE